MSGDVLCTHPGRSTQDMTTALVAIACRRATAITQPTTVVALMACIGYIVEKIIHYVHYVSNGYGNRAMMWAV